MARIVAGKRPDEDEVRSKLKLWVDGLVDRFVNDLSSTLEMEHLGEQPTNPQDLVILDSEDRIVETEEVYRIVVRRRRFVTAEERYRWMR